MSSAKRRIQGIDKFRQVYVNSVELDISYWRAFFFITGGENKH